VPNDQAKGLDEWIPKTWTEWLDDDEYRIDPICQYAIDEKLRSAQHE